MEHLHYDLNLTSGDAVRVTLNNQANVCLLDSTNYQYYRQGAKYKYYGGLAKRSPYTLSAPCAGHWHLVIDLGGRAGRISASVDIISN